MGGVTASLAIACTMPHVASTCVAAADTDCEGDDDDDPAVVGATDADAAAEADIRQAAVALHARAVAAVDVRPAVRAVGHAQTVGAEAASAPESAAAVDVRRTVRPLVEAGAVDAHVLAVALEHAAARRVSA